MFGETRFARMNKTGLSVTIAALLTVARPLSSQTSTVEGRVMQAGHGTSEAVVYLMPERSDESEEIGRPDRHQLIDQVGLRFVPTVLAVQPGTAVEFRNSDPILHNVFSPTGPGAGFNLGMYPRTESRSHTFAELGAHVILCRVHPEMYAYVIVVPSPYQAVVDNAGHFQIADVPAGEYVIHVWHRPEGRLSRPVTVEGGTIVNLTLVLRGQGR